MTFGVPSSYCVAARVGRAGPGPPEIPGLRSLELHVEGSHSLATPVAACPGPMYRERRASLSLGCAVPRLWPTGFVHPGQTPVRWGSLVLTPLQPQLKPACRLEEHRGCQQQFRGLTVCQRSRDSYSLEKAQKGLCSAALSPGPLPYRPQPAHC